ncbi:apolipoprotein F [Dromiciops gliroides]|uniref:apolipoprotein F n=1 Tax=Dromiciops gliroides TaxID=33562 RepID=UPI001CC756D3|nr:apolipoprotein F [Dromiciops gliroides]XP_043821053.1 apolipoprotein F [Dromiciops gliroides]
MLVTVILFGFLLYPVAAFPDGSDKGPPLLPPLSLESQPPILGSLSCWNLLPESLPDFDRLAPLPRYLIGLALYITLEQAGCPTDARVLEQQLYRLGGVKVTETLIQQLQGLRGDRRGSESHQVLFLILQFLGRNQRLGRAPRSLSSAHCVHEKEQQVHSVIQFLPQVGSYYNLGMAFYYAAQNCMAQARERVQEAALDLGSDFLVGLMGITGGPAGILVGVPLRPVIKSGVQKLIEYYYSSREGLESPSLGTYPSWQKDWGITSEKASSPVTPTIISSKHMADEVTEATSLWNWGSFKSWGW